MTVVAKIEGKRLVGRRQTYGWRCLWRFLGQDPMSGRPIEEEAGDAMILQGDRTQGAEMPESRSQGQKCMKRRTSLVFLQAWCVQRDDSGVVIYSPWWP